MNVLRDEIVLVDTFGVDVPNTRGNDPNRERQRIKIRQRMGAIYSLPNLDSLSSFATTSSEVSFALRENARHDFSRRHGQRAIQFVV